MSVGKINVTETLANVEDLLAQDRSLSPAARAMFELLVTIIHLLVAKLGFNSSNSSIPPSQDPRRQRGAKSKSKGRKRKPGGQKGHPGTTLQRYEARQVIDILITKFVIEYRAEILQDAAGYQFVAQFPAGVTPVFHAVASMQTSRCPSSCRRTCAYRALASSRHHYLFSPNDERS